MEVYARNEPDKSEKQLKKKYTWADTYCANSVQGKESPCSFRKIVIVSYDSRHLWYTAGSCAIVVGSTDPPTRDKKV